MAIKVNKHNTGNAEKRKKKEKILIVEDDPDMLRLLQKALHKRGYESVIAHNGKDGLEKLSQGNFPLTITDLEMPIMGGQDFITEARARGLDTVFMILTSRSEVETIVELVKLGAYDYIVKPFKETEFLHKISLAQEFSRLKSLERSLEKENLVRLDNQLSWNNWKQNVLVRDKERFSESIFQNLKISFTQGSGFGTLLGLVLTLPDMLEDKGEYYALDKELMELLTVNAKVAGTALDVFREVDEISSREYPLDPIPVSSLRNFIADITAELKSSLDIKRQNVVLSELKVDQGNIILKLNLSLLKKALEEILINAMKFSPEKSSIIVLFNTAHNSFQINFLNVPLLSNGIPDEFRNVIFEPFFRLSRHVDERYSTLDFGLGLTLVSKIIQKHDGALHINNIVDRFSSPDKELIRVSLNIDLPFRNNN